MRGVLLDTHALYWLVSGLRPLSDEALVAIGEAQASRSLFVSPITAWELSLAVRKPSGAPQIGDLSPGDWFRAAVREATARIAPIGSRIAAEAAEVVISTGHKDPGDCFLIATARVRRLSLVTRDAVMMNLADAGFIDVVRC